MNASQRKFLVDKISENINKKIKELEQKLQPYSSASNYIFKAVMTDQLELQPPQVIMEAIKTKALNAREGENWLSKERMGVDRETNIKLKIEDLIKLPKDYRDKTGEIEAHNKAIKTEIEALKAQLNTLEVRIQLSSNKKLESLINEVDDLGDIKLIDTKLKLLN